MKELERYLRATYSDSCHPYIITETTTTFPEPDITNITDLGTDLPKTDVEMTYLGKNNIDESIYQNLRKKDIYELDMHKIYNIIVNQNKRTNTIEGGFGLQLPSGQY